MKTKLTTRNEYLKRINMVVEYINSNLDNRLDLNKLAEISNLSSYHFHRVTKAILGEPIGTFITRTRIETSAKLIRYTKLSIEEIAYCVGYDIPSSLSKAFKKFYNISPKEYRNKSDYNIMRPLLVDTSFKLKSPKIVELPKKLAIYIRITGEYGNENYSKTWKKLWQHVKENKLFTAGIEHIGVSHDDPKVTDSENCRYDACLVLHKPTQAKGEIGVKEISGGKYAVFQYQGSYDNLGIVYDTIFNQWLLENEYELRNVPSFEKYINNPDKTEPEKLKTEIYLPIK